MNRTARQIAQCRRGTSVVTRGFVGNSGFERADGSTRWTVVGSAARCVILEGRTADRVFVPFESTVRFEVVR